MDHIDISIATSKAEISPIIIGLTGGIGSGKTTIANWFAEDGFPVYNSDERAKILMSENTELKMGLVKAFGEEVFENGVLNKKYLAKIIFNDNKALAKINQLVHPIVFIDFKNWAAAQKSKFVIKEAAILLESGSYKDCDAIVLVTSDTKNRLARVEERDNAKKEEILKRMEKQWTDEKKKEFAHFIIENNEDLISLKEKYAYLLYLLHDIGSREVLKSFDFPVVLN